MAQPDDATPVRVEIETERIPGVIELGDLASRLRDVAVRTEQAGPRDREHTEEAGQRADRVARLARELAQELKSLGDPR